MEALDKAIWFAGGVTRLAKLMGIDHSNIAQWRRKNHVPARRAMQIERITKGAIRAFDFYEDQQ